MGLGLRLSNVSFAQAWSFRWGFVYFDVLVFMFFIPLSNDHVINIEHNLLMTLVDGKVGKGIWEEKVRGGKRLKRRRRMGGGRRE